MSGDYFGRPDSSLACSFSPQGLFRPPGFIPSLLFFSTGIISIGQIHLWLAFFLHRDYFYRPASSPACSFSPQGLFRPPGFIPSLLFFSTGIISFVQIHPYLALFFRRDYFGRPDSSPACSFLPQGLFRPPGFIPSLLFCSAGIIPAVRIHPRPALFPTGIISIGQIHLWLALLFRRDYFGRLDSSLQADFLRCGCIFAKYPSENVHHWAHRKRGCKKNIAHKREARALSSFACTLY